MLYLRTLDDATTHRLRSFDLNHFADRANDGTPMNCCHTLYSGNLWIGHIFKEFAGEDWQIALTGSTDIRGAWTSFDEALSRLWQWHKDDVAATNDWRAEHGLKAIAVPIGDVGEVADKVLVMQSGNHGLAIKSCVE